MSDRCWFQSQFQYDRPGFRVVSHRKPFNLGRFCWEKQRIVAQICSGATSTDCLCAFVIARSAVCATHAVFEPDPAQVQKALADERLSAAFAGLPWFDTKEDILGDATITGVACEGDNAESLGMTAEIIAAGKHCWLDKPAGDDWNGWEEVTADAARQGLQIQLGYMLRYNPAFELVTTWARSGLLGDIFKIRADMSKVTTFSSDAGGASLSSRLGGGIFFDLGGHMLDQITWIMGRPDKTQNIVHFTQTLNEEYPDNTLGVLEYSETGGIAIIDLSAREYGGHRRFEVFGTKGAAIIVETFMDGKEVKLTLDAARGGYKEGDQVVYPNPLPEGQNTFDLSAEAFAAGCRGEARKVAAHTLTPSCLDVRLLAGAAGAGAAADGRINGTRLCACVQCNRGNDRSSTRCLCRRRCCGRWERQELPTCSSSSDVMIRGGAYYQEKIESASFDSCVCALCAR